MSKLSRSDLFTQFKRIYPECSRKEVEDLIEAIKGDKYWLVSPNHKDAIYVVALTKANIPRTKGFQAKATHLKKIVVVPEAARFSRKGRVIMAIKLDSDYIAKSVVSWSAFLRLMDENPDAIYNMLIEGKIPPFVNNNNISAIVLKARERG
ncbi:MAG: hypothetical protein H3Z52_15485 [archaeon]|nr:hypothetical protein [archaeon]